MSKTFKLSLRNSTMTVSVESYNEVYGIMAQLQEDGEEVVSFHEVDDGIESDPLDPKTFGNINELPVSRLDKELYAMTDAHVQFSQKSDGTIGVSRIVWKRNAEVRGGSAKDRTVSAYEKDPVAHTWACDHAELWDDQPSEDDVLAHIADSYVDGGVNEDEEEFDIDGDEMDDAVAHGDSWDLVFWTEAKEDVVWEKNDQGKLVKRVYNEGKVEKSAPLYYAPAAHKPLIGEAIGILAAIKKGNIRTGRELFLACKRVQKNEASRLWDAFKVVSYMKK